MLKHAVIHLTDFHSESVCLKPVLKYGVSLNALETAVSSDSSLPVTFGVPLH